MSGSKAVGETPAQRVQRQLSSSFVEARRFANTHAATPALMACCNTPPSPVLRLLRSLWWSCAFLAPSPCSLSSSPPPLPACGSLAASSGSGGFSIGLVRASTRGSCNPRWVSAFANKTMLWCSISAMSAGAVDSNRQSVHNHNASAPLGNVFHAREIAPSDVCARGAAVVHASD